MRTDFSAEMVEDLEKQLKLSLKPVKPNQEFVSHLHTRLSNPARTTIERRQSTAFGMLLIGAAMFFGVFFIWLMHQFRSNPKDEVSFAVE